MKYTLLIISFFFFGLTNAQMKSQKSVEVQSGVSFHEFAKDKILHLSKARSSSSIKPMLNAAEHLKKSGNYMTWGVLATSAGSVLIQLGEPASGLLLAIGGIVLEFSAYSQLKKAGDDLELAAE